METVTKNGMYPSAEQKGQAGPLLLPHLTPDPLQPRHRVNLPDTPDGARPQTPRDAAPAVLRVEV